MHSLVEDLWDVKCVDLVRLRHGRPLWRCYIAFRHIAGLLSVVGVLKRGVRIRELRRRGLKSKQQPGVGKCCVTEVVREGKRPG